MNSYFQDTYQKAILAWEQKSIGDSQMASIAFLSMGEHFYGASFFQRKLPTHEEMLEIDFFKTENLIDLFSSASFKKVKAKVNSALLHWLKNKWDLKLITTIPKPVELLKVQAQGQRYVTLIKDPTCWQKKVLTKDNAFHFLVHDLEHAHQFFYFFHQEQVDFYKKILDAYENNDLQELSTPKFKTRLDYLLSDMNTHPSHAQQYLEALWYDYFDNSPKKEQLVAQKMQSLQM